MFIWVQVLRGFAAAMVVCHHYVASQIIRDAEVGRWMQDFGGSGVDIFFVISGFIMMMTQSDPARPLSVKGFLLRRFLRIVPLYWALTTLAFAMVLLAGNAVNTEISLPKFVMSMLFLPYSTGDLDMSMKAHTAYVIPMSWTLTYEWYFYLVFALTLAIGLRSLQRLGFLATWFAISILTGIALQPAGLILQVLVNPIVIEFLLGCCIAVIYERGYRLNGYFSMGLGLLALLILVNIFHHTPFDRVAFWGTAAFVLVAVAVLYDGKTLPQIWIKPLSRLGDVSYSLYLSHFFTLALFVRLQKHFEQIGDSFGVLSLFVFVVLVLLVAELSYRLIEEPARKLFARRRRFDASAVTT